MKHFIKLLLNLMIISSGTIAYAKVATASLIDRVFSARLHTLAEKIRSIRIVTIAILLGLLPKITEATTQSSLPPGPSTGSTIQIQDLYSFEIPSDVGLSPDGQFASYKISRTDSPGHPRTTTMIMDLTSRQNTSLVSHPIVGNCESSVFWSPNGKWIACQGSVDGKAGLYIAKPNGKEKTFLAPITGTNAPLPGIGNNIAWSPDSKQIAFISATPGPEPSANGDPQVITRYLYKPTASQGANLYNDNMRLHIFTVDVTTKKIKQLTKGDRYEHSIQWSPRGDVILFESNLQPNPDQDFSYDILTVKISDGSIKQLTHSVGPKYGAVWSPDGSLIAYTHTVRPITSMETTGEDTHLWVMNADGTNAHILPGQLDLRYGDPQWSADGAWLYSTVQNRGQVRLIKTPVTGGTPVNVIANNGSVLNFALANNGSVAYSYTTPTSPPNLYLLPKDESTPKQLTNMSQQVLSKKIIAPVQRVEFKSFDGTPVEAFLTEPANLGTHPVNGSVPLIVILHGGPHSQQGSELNSTAQIYAGHGFATLMVNYRGSTGYGQIFEDKIIGDQDGAESKDVLAAVDTVLAKYKWLDPNRLGIEGISYGGQLTNWLITQTTRFKAAISIAGISNLVSANYLSYYHDYLPSEYRGYFNTPQRKDLLWNRSPIRYANQVKTPLLFIHGANDNDVPPEQAQQYFIALKDVGVETMLVLYPREGHGLAETAHNVDKLTRSLEWYDSHFISK